MPEIDKDFCFCYENGNSQQRQAAYKYYGQNEPGGVDAWGFDNQSIIFLDTNVLLKTYFLSKIERKSVVNFIVNNKDRIVIASQVDKEYQKHRLEYISGYDKQLTQLKKDTKGIIDSCLKSLKGEAINQIKSLANNHLLKYDFSEEFQTLNKIMGDMQAYIDCLKENRENIISALQNFQESINNHLRSDTSNDAMYMEDELLDAISQCTILPSLTELELKNIKEIYDECLVVFDKKKTEGIGRYKYAFPGCGDRKKDEQEDRLKESDMVIYHEMLKYMKQNDTNVIFLTFDLAKGDWVPGRGYNEVFLHYIENQYAKTGHVAYVKSGDELPLMFGNEPKCEDEDSDGDDFLYTINNLEEVDLFGEKDRSDKETDKVETEGTTMNEQKPNVDGACESHKNFRKIDENRFMSELQTCSKWASQYGAGFVGRDYFIYGLLGRQKHFEFNQSRLVLKSLVESGKIIESVGDNGDATIKISK